MPEKNRLAFVIFGFLVLFAGLSSFLALRPATVIPKNQAITQKKLECEFVAFHRDKVGKQGFHCVDEHSLKSALVTSAGLGAVTLAALGYIIVVRRDTRTESEWRYNLGGYLAIVGCWIWLTVLYIAMIRLAHFAFGRVNMDYLFVTLIWMATAVALPLLAWMKSK